jgi:hypothetical protein
VTAERQFARRGIIQFGAPQRYFAVTLALIHAVAEALLSPSDDLWPATHHLLIDIIYANI